MTPELQDAISRSASRLGAKPVDADIFRAFPKLSELDHTDDEGIDKAVKALANDHPSLFRIEKKWGELSEDDFQKREAAFRASLRTSHRVGPLPWKLDAALLDDSEMQALTRVLQGRGSSYDRSILDYAQRRLSSTGDNAGK
jgi:hypothetical protein